MSEWHDYSPNNISSCQECKELHDKYKDEDGQVEDYHQEVPIGEKTFSQRYNVPENRNSGSENKKKGTKRAYDASISNLYRGDNVRFKKGNYGNSQLDNLEVYEDEDEDEDEATKYGGKKRRTRRKKTHRKRKSHKKKSHRKRKTMKKRRN